MALLLALRMVVAIPAASRPNEPLTERNAAELARALETGDLARASAFYAPYEPPSLKVWTKLAQVPTAQLVDALVQAPAEGTRSLAAHALAFQGDRAGLTQILLATRRGDLSVEDLHDALRLSRHLSLPGDLEPTLEDTSLECTARQKWLDLLALAPSPASYALLKTLYEDPAKRTCRRHGRGGNYDSQLESRPLLDLLTTVGGPAAVPFLASLPRCSSPESRAEYPNPDRAMAITLLAGIGGGAAISALLAYTRETFPDDERRRCLASPPAWLSPLPKHPWRVDAVRALVGLKVPLPADLLAKELALDALDADSLFWILGLGAPVGPALSRQLGQPTCAQLIIFGEVGRELGAASSRSLRFLAGTPFAAALGGALSALAGTPSPIADALRADNPRCTEGLSAEGLADLSAAVADPGFVSPLTALYAKLPPNGVGDAILTALGAIGTEEAQAELLEVLRVEQRAGHLRQTARTALAAARGTDGR